MDGFTLVDGAVIGIILISALLAYARGFVREVLSIVGWILATIVAFIFTPTVDPLLQEIPGLGIITSSCQLSIFASFTLVFVVSLIVISIFTPVFSGAIQNSTLGPVDNGLGLLFGAARGLLLIAIAFMLYRQWVGTEQTIAQIENAATLGFMEDIANRLQGLLPTELPEWFSNRLDGLLGTCIPETESAT